MNRRVFLLLTTLPLLLLDCDGNPAGPPAGNDQQLPFLIIDESPAWSPDGNTIAYYHRQTIDSSGHWGPDTSGLYLINPDGSDKQLLLTGFAHSPDWSPDGQWIVFEQGAQIYKIKVTGDSLIQLTFEDRNFFPAWSPDGQWIAYSTSICSGDSTCGIWIVSSNGGGMRFIDHYGNYPTWHPFNGDILYSRRAVTKEGKVLGDSLWVYNLQTTSKSFLVFLSGQHYDNRYLRHSPNGLRILFVSQAQGSSPQLWVMDSDGGNQVQLTQDGGWTGDWSHDGQAIVFTNTLDGRLWIMDADGHNWRQLTFDLY